MISVIQNAYLRKAEENKNFNRTHRNILNYLMIEKKYCEKDKLLCFCNHNLRMLDLILKDLSDSGTILVEGWLVRLKDFEEFHKHICEELIEKE